jgi:hypothetical protein
MPRSSLLKSSHVSDAFSARCGPELDRQGGGSLGPRGRYGGRRPDQLTLGSMK